MPSENLPALTQTLWEGPSGPIFLPKRSSAVWGSLRARFWPLGPYLVSYLVHASPVSRRSSSVMCRKPIRDTDSFVCCKYHARDQVSHPWTLRCFKSATILYTTTKTSHPRTWCIEYWIEATDALTPSHARTPVLARLETIDQHTPQTPQTPLTLTFA